MSEFITKSCHECGLVSQFSELAAGQHVSCSRCHHPLQSLSTHRGQGVIAYSIASLIALVMSLVFPYMSFSVKELSQEITLYQAIEMMYLADNIIIATFLFAAVILLPAYFLLCSAWLYFKADFSCCESRHQRVYIRVLKSLYWIRPWLMVDVFLIGVLVSLIKIAGLAEVSMGLSFWSFCCYTLLLVKTVTLIDLHWLWDKLLPLQQSVVFKQSVQEHGFLPCFVCGHIHAYHSETTHCQRCASHLHHFNPKKNLQLAWALLVTSIIFYLPANLYPMMYTSALGSSEASTIMQGVVILWQMGSYPVALIIFIASVFIPLAKMLALAFLYVKAEHLSDLADSDAKNYLRVYRITEFIGRWSMIDIFVVTILVALVHIDGVMMIYPGAAVLSFAAVVVFTMLSAIVFDSRMIWKQSSLR